LDTNNFSGTNLKFTDLKKKQLTLSITRNSHVGYDRQGIMVLLKWFEIHEILYAHQKWMKTRPKLNALEMYSTGCDSKNGIPNNT
jgi:hypothetical protein